MNLYAILRRSGWKSPEDLQQAAQRSTEEGERRKVGTVCIYEATSPQAIREHSSAAELPVDEIIPIADTVIVRPDPVAAA